MSSKRPYCYAGSYEECTRKLALYMTDGDKIPPFEVETLAKFHRGNDRERNLKIDLVRVGQICEPKFEVIGQQERFEIKDRSGRVVIVGKFDARLQFGKGCAPPLEIKDWNENLTARIETFEDCFRSPWTKKGAYQLLSYLYGSGEPFGFLLLGKSGLPALLPVTLTDHLERVEEFLQKAETAVDMKDQQEAGYPWEIPHYAADQSECKRCPFMGSVCNPPISTGQGAQIFTDPEEEQKLLRMLELEPLGEEYADLEAWAKKRYRGVEMGLAGSVLVTGKWQRDTKYDIPPRVKAQMDELKAPFKKVIEQGKYFLTVSKL